MIRVSSQNFANRRSTPGPESQLVEASLEAGLPFRFRGQPITYEEPRMPTGFPDVVAIYDSGNDVLVNSFRNQLDSRHLKVLHHIYCERFVTLDNLASQLNLTASVARRLIDDLMESDLIQVRKKSISIRSLAEIFAARRIVAIEAKISNWKKALQQANLNTWFASDSYILIPERKDTSAVLDKAKQFGLGVMTFGDRGNKILLRSEVRKIPRSYGSWMFNEWLVRELFTHDRRRSHSKKLS